VSQELRQVHNVKSFTTVRYVEDDQGMTQRQVVERFAKSDTDRITYGPTGETFEIAADGSFYVPVEVAEFLTRQPDWHSGPSPFAPEEPVEEPKPRSSEPRQPAADAGAPKAPRKRAAAKAGASK
jgi:hypothetical protein